MQPLHPELRLLYFVIALCRKSCIPARLRLIGLALLPPSAPHAPSLSTLGDFPPSCGSNHYLYVDESKKSLPPVRLLPKRQEASPPVYATSPFE